MLLIGIGMLLISIVMTLIIGRTVFRTNSEQAEKLIAFAKPNSYPKVKDGGEVTHTGKASTREQFAEWANQIIGG